MNEQRERRPLVALIASLVLLPGSVQALNNCADGDFADRSGLAELVIANDDPLQPHRYRPRCSTVSEGTVVVFVAIPNFGSHPLYGGTVSGGVATIDPDSPIASANNGSQVERLLEDSREFPFFCDFHYAMG